MARSLLVAMLVAMLIAISAGFEAGLAKVPNLRAEPASPSSASSPSPATSTPSATGVRTAVEPPSARGKISTARKPPSGLWGATLQDGNDKGIKKATGGAYNYRHIAISAGFVVLIIIGLIVLVRRHTGEPRMPGR